MRKAGTRRLATAARRDCRHGRLIHCRVEVILSENGEQIRRERRHIHVARMQARAKRVDADACMPRRRLP